MVTTIYHLLRTARPRQWSKNLAVFAAPVFLGTFFYPNVFYKAFLAFVIFCAISSAGYYINDLVDAEKDLNHPVKKNRAIASGKVSKVEAIFVIIFLLGISIPVAYFYVGSFFAIAALTYIFLQLIYSFYLRNIIILDALLVATLFIIRVFAGGFATNISISSWLILATTGLSLLLAFGKRRSEKTILSKYDAEKSSKTRETLRHYPDSLLDSMISMSAGFTLVAYALFTFQTSPQDMNPILQKLLPSTLQSPRWMMLTVPLVIYGIARYLFVIYEKREGESPELVLISDKPLLSTVIIWIILVLVITTLFPGFNSSNLLSL